jgi:tetratricopeptide (TPR) repeat protein
MLAEVCEKLLLVAERCLSECNPNTAEELASCHLVCGIIHHQLGDIQNTTTHLHSVINTCKDSSVYANSVLDKYHEPFAWYELGVVNMKAEKHEDALKAIEKCMNCSDGYCFDSQLGFRAKSAKKHLETILGS